LLLAHTPILSARSNICSMSRALSVCLVLTCTLAASLSAQWGTFKRPDAPRRPDGTVDVAAPAPKFLDGRPDLSGVWENPGWREGAGARGIITGVGGAPGTRTEASRRRRRR